MNLMMETGQSQLQGSAASVSALLERYGKHSLAPATVQSGLEYFAVDTEGFIASRVIGQSRLVLGDPVASPETASSLLSAFIGAYPHAVFAQVSDRTAGLLEKNGYAVAELGAECWLRLPYHLHGRDKAAIRNLHNRGRAASIRVVELSDTTTAASGDHDLHAGINGDRSRFHHSLRFLVRPLDDTSVSGTRVFAGYVGDRIVGLSVFDPLYDDGIVYAYAEAVPQRRLDAPKGTRVFILLEAMKQFSREGIEYVSLGLMPFRPATETGTNGRYAWTDRLFSMLYKHGSVFFNFKGLTFHKSLFHGEERPVYLASRSRLPLKDLWHIYRATTGR